MSKYGLEKLPGEYVAPEPHSLNSIAISLKRIADALESGNRVANAARVDDFFTSGPRP